MGNRLKIVYSSLGEAGYINSRDRLYSDLFTLYIYIQGERVGTAIMPLANSSLSLLGVSTVCA